MKYDKFFNVCQSKGITDSQLIINSNYTLAISVFDGEIREYQVSDSNDVTAKGIYNNKLGSVHLDSWSNSQIDKVTDEIISEAKVIENHDPVFIYEGSKTYKRFNVFDKELNEIDASKKIEVCLKLNDKIKNADPRVDKVEISYEDVVNSYTIINSKGLKLTQKCNYFIIYAGVYVRDGETVKTGLAIKISNHFSDIDIDEIAERCLKDGLSKLGGVGCDTKKYKAILKQEVVATLLEFYVTHAYADNVQKGTSVWIDKVGQEVASKKLSIIDKPLTRNVFGRYFDDEGVACYDKPIIKYGILSNYLYDLTSAAKAGVESTGNGFGGSKVTVGTSFLSIRPGRKTLDELAAKVHEGVYITEIEGLQGINPQNGDFSLQSTGFLIEDGKIGKPLDLITISGNIFTLFKDITDIGSELKLTTSGSEVPPLVVKKLIVASKGDDE